MPHLNIHALRHVAALNTVSGEGLDCAACADAVATHASTYSPAQVHEAMNQIHDQPNILPPSPDSPIELSHLIALDGGPSPVLSRLENSHMTPDERNLRSFTRKRLQTLSNWAVWDDAFDSQLNGHHDSGTLNHPVPRPFSTKEKPVHILRIQWSNIVKDS